MSTVLEKPVLLDETGQEIVDKLEEIKTAIGNSGEYIPLAIRVTTPPTKTSYYAGDSLDLSGIVVSLVGSNGSLVDVTAACTFSPANGATLSTSDNNVSIIYHYQKDNLDFTATIPIIVEPVVATSISVIALPSKTSYLVGENLDLTGVRVDVLYNNGNSENVTSSCIFDPADQTILNDPALDHVSVSYTEQGITFYSSFSISVVLYAYGAEWDGTADPTWTRTDMASDFTDPIPQMSDGNGGWTVGSSPFDDIAPWSEMVKITDANAGTLVKIPKYWYKWTRNGIKMKLQISPIEIPGFHVSPAHADRGDGNGERDFVYVGRYHCATSTYKSDKNYYPQASKTISEFRTAIHNLGSDIWQYDFAMFWTIMMLYLVEFANWNTQSMIGHGCGNNTSVEKTGMTDSMSYHTGTNQSALSTYGHIQYRNIEDLWANVFDFIDGINLDGTDIYIIKNPADFADTGGVKVGERRLSSGTISEWTNPDIAGYEFALYPKASGGGVYTEYSCDNSNQNTTGKICKNGAYYGNTEELGGFVLRSTNAANASGADTGSRLMKLPNS